MSMGTMLDTYWLSLAILHVDKNNKQSLMSVPGQNWVYFIGSLHALQPTIHGTEIGRRTVVPLNLAPIWLDIFIGNTFYLALFLGRVTGRSFKALCTFPVVALGSQVTRTSAPQASYQSVIGRVKSAWNCEILLLYRF